jgi:hypothetical protein
MPGVLGIAQGSEISGKAIRFLFKGSLNGFSYF